MIWITSLTRYNNKKHRNSKVDFKRFFTGDLKDDLAWLEEQLGLKSSLEFRTVLYGEVDQKKIGRPSILTSDVKLKVAICEQV